MKQRVGTLIGCLLFVGGFAAIFAACVWLVASLTAASLAIRWQVTGVAFGVAFMAILVVFSACWVSGSISQDEERRDGIK